MDDNGILIITTGRAGSSMVAGLFERHGVWVGDARPSSQFNPKGFFENIELKTAQRKFFVANVTGDLPVYRKEWKGIVYDTMRNQGYKGGPWLFKTGAFWLPIWEPIVDKVVMVRRPYEKVMDSYERCKFMEGHKEDLPFIIKRQMDMMEEIDAPTVYTEDVIRGDYGSLERAFAHCGLKLDMDIAHEFIETDLYSL